MMLIEQRLVRGRNSRRSTSTNTGHREKQRSNSATCQGRPKPSCEKETSIRKGQAKGWISEGRVQGRTSYCGWELRWREDWYFHSRQVEKVLVRNWHPRSFQEWVGIAVRFCLVSIQHAYFAILISVPSHKVSCLPTPRPGSCVVQLLHLRTGSKKCEKELTSFHLALNITGHPSSIKVTLASADLSLYSAFRVIVRERDIPFLFTNHLIINKTPPLPPGLLLAQS